MHVEKTTFKNKIRLLTVNLSDSQSTTVAILVKTGSRFETANNSGIAHFVEHMMFKGTKSRPTSKQIGMEIETIGGTSNAFTSQDYTGYYIKVPKENTAKAIPILTDMLTDGLFDTNEINKERGVIIEEIRMYEDRPMNKVGSYWSEKFFGNTPLGRDIAGSIGTVSKFQRDDFIKFIEAYYGGENLLVVVAGDFDKSNLHDQIEQVFEKLNNNPLTDFEKYSETKVEPRIENLYKPIEQSHLLMGTYSHNRTFEGKYKFRVFNSILGMGFGSRLFQVIRDELGLAYYVYSNQSSFEDIGTYEIGLGVENSKISSAVEAVMKQIRLIMNGDFSDEELIRAKNFLLGNLITDFESTDDVALWYGIQELQLDKYYKPSDIKEFISKVTKDDVVEVSTDMFRNKGFLLAGVTPHKQIDESLISVLHL